MAERVKKHRRSPWLLLAIGLILLSGPIAWTFRPLNDTERHLVGRWSNHISDRTIAYVLTSDRRYRILNSRSRDMVFEGGWRASGENLYLYPDAPWPTSWDTLKEQLRSEREHYVVELQGHHTLKFSMEPHIVWYRLSD